MFAAGAAFVTLQLITSAFSESSAELDRFTARVQALGGPDVQGQSKSLTEEIARQQAIVDGLIGVTTREGGTAVGAFAGEAVNPGGQVTPVRIGVL